MSTFQLLSDQIQKKIWNMRWKSFTPIQDQAIPVILKTDKDVVLSSGTASGKTEAAFLPILSLIENEAPLQLKVLYISPLKALINNQFERIDKLCEDTNIPIYRWHGDVNQSQKQKLVKNPAGVLQITPESVESLFPNRTRYLNQMFRYLDFVVIDEIHSFIGKERGVHLRSLLSRICGFAIKSPRFIGLSATIDNFGYVQEWINPVHPEDVEIVEAPGNDRQMLYSLMHFSSETPRLPVSLLEDIRELTRENKAIIFCNQRSQVEEATVFLNRLAEREGVGETYFAHHSSIDKKEREYVEKTIKSSKTPKSVVATSSLELGIDIGDLDLVIQLDSTHSVSSLKQRLGRSGRKRDSDQMLQLYTTYQDSLLQSLAVMELILEKWIGPAGPYPEPYDILFHQIMSICHETNGVTINELLSRIQNNTVFKDLCENHISAIIDQMVKDEMLEIMKGTRELIVGLEGEKILRSRDFYSVFITPRQYTVINHTRQIGTLDKGMAINPGDNIILAGKLWTVMEIDEKRDKIYVTKANDAKPPIYMGGGGKLHDRIADKMQALLCSDQQFHYINEQATEVLEDIRRPYHLNQVTIKERILWNEQSDILFETYTGTTIARTLMWMFRYMGVKIKKLDAIGRMIIHKDPNIDIIQAIDKVKNKEWSVNDILEVITDHEWFTSKYSVYLPDHLQKEMHIAHEIDIQGTIEYLNKHIFKYVLSS